MQKSGHQVKHNSAGRHLFRCQREAHPAPASVLILKHNTNHTSHESGGGIRFLFDTQRDPKRKISR